MYISKWGDQYEVAKEFARFRDLIDIGVIEDETVKSEIWRLKKGTTEVWEAFNKFPQAFDISSDASSDDVSIVYGSWSPTC